MLAFQLQRSGILIHSSGLSALQCGTQFSSFARAPGNHASMGSALVSRLTKMKPRKTPERTAGQANFGEPDQHAGVADVTDKLAGAVLADVVEGVDLSIMVSGASAPGSWTSRPSPRWN